MNKAEERGGDKQKGNQQRQATRTEENKRPKQSGLVRKGDHVATGTGDSNESEKRQSEATATEQGRPGGERTKAGAKNTTRSKKRNSHEGRKGSPRNKEESKAGWDYTKENQPKRREAALGQPRDCQGELAAQREQEECQSEGATGGVGFGKTGTQTIENWERYKRLRIAEKDRKDQGRNAACGKAKTKGKIKEGALAGTAGSNPTNKAKPRNA